MQTSNAKIFPPYLALPADDAPGCSHWYELSDSYYRLRADGILELRHKHGSVQELDSARAFIRAANELLGNKKVPFLVVIEGSKGQKREARRFLISPEGISSVCTRIALVVRSPMSRVLANAFRNLVRIDIPLCVFSDEQKALLWLGEAPS